MKKKKTNNQIISRNIPNTTNAIILEIRSLIESARGKVASFANLQLTMLYWRIGQRVYLETLDKERAEYGKQILPTLSAELMPVYGEGFSERNLARMVKFAEYFPEEQIVKSLSQQLNWSSFVEILSVKDSLARDFYAQICRIQQWNVRTLRSKIKSMLFERTGLSKKPKKLARLELAKLKQEDKLTPDFIFHDPYFLDFLGLKGVYQEKDLETAILRQIEAFILELGIGFTFVARQKRIIVDSKDFYLDLLFYHRDLRRLVAVELKIGEFEPAFKGQMELYLRWLDKYERKIDEEHPLGLILCATKSAEQIELLELDKSGIHVAEYLTQLPPRKILEKKLHQAIKEARLRLEYKGKKVAKAV